jgi:hypothetical protein
VNQQSANQHLAYRNHVPCQRLAGMSESHVRRQTCNHTSEYHSGPDVKMGLAMRAVPGEGGHKYSENDPGDPLKDKQPGEQTVRALADPLIE